MGSLEAKYFLQNIKKLSSKELQELCRACDLSPRKNKYKMQKSLISHFKVKGAKFLQDCNKKREEMEHSNISSQTELTKDVTAPPPPPVKSQNVLPSFEVSVRSDEGINLVVDLNSKPLDLSNQLKNGVCVCDTFWKGNLKSFCKEQQILSPTANKSENKHDSSQEKNVSKKGPFGKRVKKTVSAKLRRGSKRKREDTADCESEKRILRKKD